MKLLKTPWAILTLGIAVALVVPGLMMDGMFVDATCYTSVGLNLANGYGSPWQLFYSVDHVPGPPGFYENPPLGYWMFAFFFYLFGDSIFVERFYLLLVFLTTIYFIQKTWKVIIPAYRSIGWLPVLMWIIVPLSFWAYNHNVMENTMALFVFGGVLLAWRSFTANKSYLWAALAGFLLFLAFMVKGVPGMFPLVVPAIYWMVYRSISFRRMLGLTFTMLIFSFGMVLLLFTFPEGNQMMEHYFFGRTLQRINEIPVVDNRLSIVGELLQQMILPMLILVVVSVVGKIKTGAWQKINNKAFWFLFLLGMSGVLPLILTRVQRGFYIIPATPFVVMALAVLIAKLVDQWQAGHSREYNRIVRSIGYIILIGSIGASIVVAGKPKREGAIISDVHAIADVTGRHDTLLAPINVSHNWGVKAYFMRNEFLQLTHFPIEEKSDLPDFGVVYRGEDFPLTGYSKVNIDLQKFDLYRRID